MFWWFRSWLPSVEDLTDLNHINISNPFACLYPKGSPSSLFNASQLHGTCPACEFHSISETTSSHTQFSAKHLIYFYYSSSAQFPRVISSIFRNRKKPLAPRLPKLLFPSHRQRRSLGLLPKSRFCTQWHLIQEKTNTFSSLGGRDGFELAVKLFRRPITTVACS